MKISSVLAVALATAVIGVPNARADVVSYADFSSWSSAVSGVTSVILPEPPGGFEVISPSVSYGGVLFSDVSALSDGSLFNVGIGFSGQPAVISSQQTGFETLSFSITFGAPITAIAFDFGTFDGYDVTFEINGHSITRSSTASNYQPNDFFGVAGDLPFTTILLTSDSENLFINNINFAAPISAVPEPSTWAMMILGFVGITFVSLRRSRRSHKAAAAG